MTAILAIPKNTKVKEPSRKPDMYSKRGVPYWFGPNWVRKSGQTCGRILPIRDAKDDRVYLYMLSADGYTSYIQGSIQGSIQEEFQYWLRTTKTDVVAWRDDLEMDCLLLGVSVEDLLLSDWEYEPK